MTDRLDVKMQRVIKKMKKSYSAHNNRKSIIVLNHEHVMNIQNKIMTTKVLSTTKNKK